MEEDYIDRALISCETVREVVFKAFNALYWAYLDAKDLIERAGLRAEIVYKRDDERGELVIKIRVLEPLDKRLDFLIRGLEP